MQELLIGFGILAIYYIIAATTAISLRFLIKIPDEIFRKTLHLILLFSMAVWVFAFKTWWIAVLAAVIFEVVVFPILVLCEKLKNYSKTVTERKKGELKLSLLLVFSMFAVVMCICWGWLGDKYLVLATVYAWGIGDAAAALIGKRFGKHKINLKFTDGKKSWEGSIAMFLTSALSVAVILLVRGGLPVVGYIVVPIATAFVSAIAELYSKGGTDTVVCPFSAMAVLLPLIYAFGGLV